MIFAASLSVMPGSALSSAAVALLMSTAAVFGAMAFPCVSSVGPLAPPGIPGAVVEDGAVVPGVVVAAGWAITGAATVKANSPIGNRINFSILISCFRRQVAVEAGNGSSMDIFHRRTYIQK